MKIRILGKVWNLRFPYLDITKHRGSCDDPSTPHKEIKVAAQLKGEERLSILIHEVKHASNWVMYSEEYVDQFSKDLARILWRLNYRCMDEDDKNE